MPFLPDQPQLPTYTIVSVRESDLFAGRLGRRVDTTLTLERDGQTIHVRIGRQHTINGKPLRFKSGERVTLPASVKDRDLVFPTDVHVVKV